MSGWAWRLAGALFILAPMAANAHPVPPLGHPAASVSAAARPAAVIVDSFHAALKRGDAKAVIGLLADDVLIYESGGAERSKAEYAAAHLPADIEFARATTSTLRARAGRADGPVAWIASEGLTTGNFHGKAINSRTTETMLLRRIGSRWTIVHIHWSSGRAD